MLAYSIFAYKRNFFIVAFLFLLLISYLFIYSLNQNNGNFVYALDDPYIHMAIAKNFALHGVWGIDRFSFSPSSSSLLWTLILSGLFFIFGVGHYFPFVLNIVISIILMFYISQFLKKYLTPTKHFLILLIIVFAASFPLLVFTGQEHLLHSFITLFFAQKVSELLSNDDVLCNQYIGLFSKKSFAVLVLGFLVTFVRFEGLFILGVVSLLFFLKRKYVFALILIIVGLLPILIFGLISVHNGGFLLPNSVILKGAIPDFSNLKGIVKFFGGFAFYQMIKTPEILVIFLLALIILFLKIFQTGSIWNFSTLLLLTFLLTSLLHLQFAKVGWFYRYEAYLIIIGIPSVIASMDIIWQKFWNIHLKCKFITWFTRTLFLSLVLFPFLYRCYSTLVSILPATKNIYEQQFQMANFVKKYYQGRTVALNDIGLVNFVADIRCVDLWGLANNEVAREILKKNFNTERIREISTRSKVHIAILYEIWFKQYGGLPKEWKFAGKWQINNNVVCGSDVVSFFAVDTTEINRLDSLLKVFRNELPPGVVYTASPK